MAQGEEHVALEPDPPVAVRAAAPGLLVPRRLPRDRLERHGRVPVGLLGHDVEYDALCAAAEDGDGPEVRQAQLPRLRLRRRERLCRHGHRAERRQRCRDRSEGTRRVRVGALREGRGGGLVAVRYDFWYFSLESILRSAASLRGAGFMRRARLRVLFFLSLGDEALAAPHLGLFFFDT